jgi:hypothetical protein
MSRRRSATIMALKASADPDAKLADLDGAFADAMLMVARYYPAHDDISLLAAEAAMDTLPWDYWEPDKQSAKPRLGEAIRLVEMVSRNADHRRPHLYIHLMENGPDEAGRSGRRPAASRWLETRHLVHMPAHIYYRLGRWKDSIRVNIDAARDPRPPSRSDDKGFVRFGYYPHNVHFIVTSAQMGGDLPTAIREAKRLAGIVDAERQIAWIRRSMRRLFCNPSSRPRRTSARPSLTRASPMCGRPVCGPWPAQQKNKLASTRKWELGASMTLTMKPMADQGMPAADILAIAEHVARGRMPPLWPAPQAADHYRLALAVEDRISYMEPPWWYFPVSQSGPPVPRRPLREAQQAFTRAGQISGQWLGAVRLGDGRTGAGPPGPGCSGQGSA